MAFLKFQHIFSPSKEYFEMASVFTMNNSARPVYITTINKKKAIDDAKNIYLNLK